MPRPSLKAVGAAATEIAPFAAPAGVLLYVGLTLVCSAVFDPLGLTADEVGLGYGQLLARSAVSVAFLVMVGGLIEAGLALLGVVAKDESRTRRKWLRGSLWSTWTVGVVILVTVAMAVFFSAQARSARDKIEDGSAAGDILGFIPTPWHAETARVHWLQGATDGHTPLPGCVLFLGEADGTGVFYDASTGHALKLPSSAVVVAITNKSGC